MWFQETEHCAACCQAILEEATRCNSSNTVKLSGIVDIIVVLVWQAVSCGAQPYCDGLELPSKESTG